MRATASVVASAQPLAGPHATPVRGGKFGPPVENIARATGQTVRPVPARAVMAQPARAPATASVANHNVMRSPLQSRARAGSGGDTGRVLQATFGCNPNSSSLGVDVTFLIFGSVFASALALVLGALLRRDSAQ